MRKVFAGFFVTTATAASVAVALQACSSDDGAEPVVQPDASLVDAAADGAVTQDSGQTQDATVPPKDAPPKQTKPTDAGLDLDALAPGEHALQVNSCEAFVACGGLVDGKSFDYTGGCFDEDGLEAQVRASTACDDVDVSNSRAVVEGEFDFTLPTNFSRNLHLRVSGDVTIPGSCSFLAFVQGCQNLADNAASFGFSGLTCYDQAEGTGCDCLLNAEQTFDASGTYAVTGTATTSTLNLTSADGGTTQAPFCVDGTAMKHTDTAASTTDPTKFISWKLAQQVALP